MNTEKEYDSELNQTKMKLTQLQEENEQLLREIHQVNEKLRDSEQFKGHFISNVSNEIVNPFTSIIALSQGIRQLTEAEMQKAHQMATLIFDEAFHLDFQLKNIFAAALIEAGKEEIQVSAINLNELLKQIALYFNPLLEKKQIRLLQSCDPELVFHSDKDKLEMVFKNLISNSLKYSPENSTIKINLALNDSLLVLEVSDQGKGIHLEDRSVIFDRFKQLDEKINSINTGHGLGLSIVKAYVEMLGGEVELTDNKPYGITVCARIPEMANGEKWDDLNDFILDSEAN